MLSGSLGPEQTFIMLYIKQTTIGQEFKKWRYFLKFVSIKKQIQIWLNVGADETRTQEKSATCDFYSNQRNLISTNLTFLFIGH